MTLERLLCVRPWLAFVALGLVGAMALIACGGGSDDEPETEAQTTQTHIVEKQTPPADEPAPQETAPAPEPEAQTPQTHTVEDQTPPAGEPTTQEPVPALDPVGPSPLPEEPVPEPVNGWLRISPPGEFQDLAVDATGSVIVATGRGSGIISRDAGATWEQIDWPGDLRSRVAITAGGGQILVAALSSLSNEDTTAVWSTDGGRTWIDTELEIQGAVGAGADAFAVADLRNGLITFSGGELTGPVQIPRIEDNFDPSDALVNPNNPNDRYLVSLSEGGTAMLRRTPDGGATWAPFLADFETFGTTRIGFLPFGFVVMSWAGVLLSFDGGGTWFPQNAGLETLDEDGFYFDLVDLVVIPLGNVPVLASRENGLFRFNPSGWDPFPGPGLAVEAIEALPGTSALLAATAEGVFRLENPAIAGE